MLAKLAEGGKPADAVSNVKNNSRNFVFSHITPPNQEKTDGSTSRVKRVREREQHQWKIYIIDFTAVNHFHFSFSKENYIPLEKGFEVFFH